MNREKDTYADADAEIKRFYSILKYLSNSIDENNQVIYLIGSIYKNIFDATRQYNVDIVEIKSLRTGLLWIIPIPVSKSFIIKLKDKQDLVKLVKSLEDHDPIEVCIFNKKIEDKFLDNFDIGNREFTRNIIKEDPSYLIYGIYFDSIGSSTGAVEFISYGEKTPYKMKRYF